MKILFLTNNDISHHLRDWLQERADVTMFSDKIDVHYLKDHSVDFIVSYCYRHIISKQVIEALPGRIVNCHISLLPWNRGSDPNIWSFIENTPSGVTIHYINEGLDTGNIICQSEIEFSYCTETLRTSYNKLHQLMLNMFKNSYEIIVGGGYWNSSDGQWELPRFKTARTFPVFTEL
jgi:methionyl-tRNA formyltransferase